MIFHSSFLHVVPIAAWLQSWWNAIVVPVWSFLEMLRFYVLPLDEDYEEIVDGGTRRRGRRLAPMPELQVMTTLTNETDENIDTDKRQRSTTNKTLQELEPAFLKTEDYPPGWMVYDREAGVILKTQADKLKEEKRKQQQQQCIEEKTVLTEECQAENKTIVVEPQETTACSSETKSRAVAEETACRSEMKPPADQSPAIAAT